MLRDIQSRRYRQRGSVWERYSLWRELCGCYLITLQERVNTKKNNMAVKKDITEFCVFPATLAWHPVICLVSFYKLLFNLKQICNRSMIMLTISLSISLCVPEGHTCNAWLVGLIACVVLNFYILSPQTHTVECSHCLASVTHSNLYKLKYFWMVTWL